MTVVGNDFFFFSPKGSLSFPDWCLLEPDSECFTVHCSEMRAAGSVLCRPSLTHRQRAPAESSCLLWSVCSPLQIITNLWERGSLTELRRAMTGRNLVHPIDSACSCLSPRKKLAPLRLCSCSDRGAGRLAARSLREHGGQWILCFLAAAPSGFINWLVKRGRACCGMNPFWSKCTSGASVLWLFGFVIEASAGAYFLTFTDTSSHTQLRPVQVCMQLQTDLPILHFRLCVIKKTERKPWFWFATMSFSFCSPMQYNCTRSYSCLWVQGFFFFFFKRTF